MQVIPAILANNKDEWRELLQLAVEIKGVERVQVDFIDSSFDNETVPVALADVNSWPDIKWDAHLMLAPEVMQDEIDQAKISGYARIIAQVENVLDQELFVKYTGGYERGLAIDLDTSVEQIDTQVIKELDVVLVMSVEAGFGGQLFDNRAIEKVKELQQMRKDMGAKFKICVDGGIEKVHLGFLEEVGVDEVAVGVKRWLSWHN